MRPRKCSTGTSTLLKVQFSCATFLACFYLKLGLESNLEDNQTRDQVRIIDVEEDYTLTTK